MKRAYKEFLYRLLYASLRSAKMSYYYILYKNPVQLETLHIVQYLHSLNIHILPASIIERNHPSFITELPTIIHKNKDGSLHTYSGLHQVICFYEEISGISNLLEKANEFKKNNPKYTIK